MDECQLEVALDELRLEAEELRASRARVVRAADAERRRIERDLHDGAQQHLVALAVNVQLARQLVDSDPAEAKTLLEGIGRDVHEALERVRELAQSVYPPLLLDRGLSEALRAGASEAGIESRVETVELGRYAPEVEAAVYFCCLEALHDAALGAAAAGTHAAVRVHDDEHALHFEVAYDGNSSERPETLEQGAFVATRDHVGALGGRLTVSSGPGRRTLVSGWIPLSP